MKTLLIALALMLCCKAEAQTLPTFDTTGIYTIADGFPNGITAGATSMNATHDTAFAQMNFILIRCGIPQLSFQTSFQYVMPVKSQGFVFNLDSAIVNTYAYILQNYYILGENAHGK